MEKFNLLRLLEIFHPCDIVICNDLVYYLLLMVLLLNE